MVCNERALKLVPNHPDALLNSSSALYDEGEYQKALTWADRAILASPNRPEVHYAKGQALMQMHQFEEAVAAYSQAIELNPNYSAAYMGRGLTRSRLRDLEGAVVDYKIVERLDPNNVELYNNLGIVYSDQMLFDDAIAEYQKALVLNPENATAYGNLGVAYSACKNLDMAITAYKRALELVPTNYGVATNLSFALLAKGDFENGWRLFEARWKKSSHPRAFDKPLWLGREDLTNKKILLHAEQGFGDTIQFCRYVDQVAPKCKEAILLVHPPLVGLCQTLSCKVKVVSKEPPLSDFDLHCPLMSLPLALGTLEHTIPAAMPYLHVDSAKESLWKSRLDQYKGLKVGIVWNGGHRKDQPETWGVNARRNLPLRQLELLQMDGVQWISLQKGEEAEAELHQFNSQSHNGLNVIDWVADLSDYTDTAALIANLDLVISVDTSVAHLTGALGKPIWILNRFDSCWRWFLNRSDSPWYPTARIYNQPKPGDWKSVISEVKQDLQELIDMAE
jgi:tetratricopeptide (TPR) repeat protein